MAYRSGLTHIRAQDLANGFRDRQPLISMEEQEVLITEAGQDLAEAEEISRDTDRLEDTASAASDLADIADQIEEARPEDILMVETASRLAVAGSDVDPEEVTPGLESYVGQRISMEGVRDLVSQIWEAIKSAIKKIYEKIEAFFYKILGTVPRLRRSVKDVRKRISQANSKQIDESTTKLGAEAGSMVIVDKLPDSGASLVEGFKLMAMQTRYFMEERTTDIEALGETIVDGLGDFDEERARESLEKLVKDVKDFTGKAKIPSEIKLKLVKDSRFAPGEYSAMPAMPGGKSCFLRNPENSQRGNNDDDLLTNAEQIRRQVWSVQPTKANIKDDFKDGEIATLSTGDMEAILDEVEKIADAVESYKRGKDWDKINKVREKLSKSADKMKDRAQNSKEMTGVEVDFYRSAIKFTSFYAKTSTQPQASLVAHALKVSRASIVVCNKCLSNYN